MTINWDEINNVIKAQKGIAEFQEWQQKMGIEPKGYNLKSPWQSLPTARGK
jgi:hypothetical protein